MSYETLAVTQRDGILEIFVNRPKVLNVLNPKVVEELTAAVESVGATPDVRAVLLTGTGEKAFVAGADIAAMSDMTPEQALAFAGRGHAVGEMLTSLPVPVLAAVNGFALGGGCELALACDFIFASPNAKFGQPEVKLGVIPGFGGTQRLLRRVGLARALELCMTGDMIGADEALRLGLCNRVVPLEELLPSARKTLATIAKQGPVAIAKVKEVLHKGAEMPLPDANVLEQESFAELFNTSDQKEGMSAFLNKRKPAFRGE